MTIRVSAFLFMLLKSSCQSCCFSFRLLPNYYYSKPAVSANSSSSLLLLFQPHHRRQHHRRRQDQKSQQVLRMLSIAPPSSSAGILPTTRIPGRRSTATTSRNHASLLVQRRNMSSSSSSSNPQPASSSDTNDNNTVVSRKKVLRKKIRERVRNTIANDTEEINRQSDQVWDKLFELDIYKNAKSVGLFLNMPKGEINTSRALVHSLQMGKTIYVPQVGQNFEQCDMELLKVIIINIDQEEEDEKDNDGDGNITESKSNSTTPNILFYDNWPRNKWLIPEPPESMPKYYAKPGDIDLLIVPGLGFDRNGNRLGHGKGYYDRWIERMTKDRTLPLVAVGLTPQLVVEGDEDGSGGGIPVAEYDRRMDIVLLPNETIIINKSLVVEVEPPSNDTKKRSHDDI